jgi:hypothetical protein
MSIFVLFFIIHSIILWVILDFDPYFLSIDSCLDFGGVWNDETKQCHNE